MPSYIIHYAASRDPMPPVGSWRTIQANAGPDGARTYFYEGPDRHEAEEAARAVAYTVATNVEQLTARQTIYGKNVETWETEESRTPAGNAVES